MQCDVRSSQVGGYVFQDKDGMFLYVMSASSHTGSRTYVTFIALADATLFPGPFIPEKYRRTAPGLFSMQLTPIRVVRTTNVVTTEHPDDTVGENCTQEARS